MRTRAVAASLDHLTLDTAEARELARSGRCIGCAGERPHHGADGGGSLWCPACWKVLSLTGSLPDLLRGGEALRGG